MIHAPAAKRPAASMHAPAAKGHKHHREQRSGAMVRHHGLQDVKLTPYDLVRFKAMMDQP